MPLIFLAGGLLPALLLPVLMRKQPKPHFLPHSQRDATTHTVMMTILVAVSTFSATVITIGPNGLPGLDSVTRPDLKTPPAPRP